MGPPLKAAENKPLSPEEVQLYSGFNGAAAKSSGKCGEPGDHVSAGGDASMGPPLKAAENEHVRYNETTGLLGFNGAAAKSSGKFVKDRPGQSGYNASMGPPLKAAENPSVRR